MTDQPTPAIVALWKLEEGKRVPSARWNWGRINIRKATAKSDKYVKSTKKIQISNNIISFASSFKLLHTDWHLQLDTFVVIFPPDTYNLILETS